MLNEQNSDTRLKAIASSTRLKIIEILLANPDGLRFSEIAKGIDIYPSTLEDHLKCLIENELVSHFENKYIANLNTAHASWLATTIESRIGNSYFSTHLLTIKDPKLRDEFQHLTYEIYTDLLSILTKARNTFSQGVKTGWIGGSMNMQLEQGFFDLWKPEFSDTEVEVVFTREGVEDMKKLDHPEKFIESVDPSKTKLYIIDNCDFAIGACELGGLLFLPDLAGNVDFSHCLCFESREGIDWLRSVFDIMKSQSMEVEMSILEKEIMR